ncbi:short transient receptor potential channel 4-associated protein-like [Penaeus indicus]|uniref:short transient receptor potential channel 4-associated protein-like n=2 Tax=Penaeus TaxID=133894 RepID=UPI00300C4EB0
MAVEVEVEVRAEEAAEGRIAASTLRFPAHLMTDLINMLKLGPSLSSYRPPPPRHAPTAKGLLCPSPTRQRPMQPVSVDDSLRGCTSESVPTDGLGHMSHGEVLKALRVLEAALQRFENQRHTIMTQLKVLESNLTTGPDEYLGDSVGLLEIISLINKHSGVKTLLSLLMVPDLGTGCCDLDKCDHSATVGNLQATTLTILNMLTTLDTNIGSQLSDSDEVLQILFSHMVCRATYTRAITLIEHLLLLRKNTLQLNTIPGLDRLIGQLDGEYLANFCSILAVTISDLDVYENKSLLYEQSKLRSNIKCLSPLRDINQEFVLSIPEFLPRLVNFATNLPYEPRYEGITMEVDHWIRLIEDSMSDVLNEHNPLIVTDLMERIQPQAIVNQLEALTSPMLQRVESVYVLGLLLLGKQRKEVQTQLAQLRLIPRLSQLFDLFIWKCETYQERVRVPGHLSSCECSPEVALKIQFLRLVHSFCDQSEYRYLMLTPVEYREVCSISAAKMLMQEPTVSTPSTTHSINSNNTQESRTPPTVAQETNRIGNNELSSSGLRIEPLGGSGSLTQTPVEYPADQMCSGSQGLLSKIVEALKRETTGSTFRFWFSRAIESYLRSANPYADQVFLLRRGLLKKIHHINYALTKHNSSNGTSVECQTLTPRPVVAVGRRRTPADTVQLFVQEYERVCTEVHTHVCGGMALIPRRRSFGGDQDCSGAKSAKNLRLQTGRPALMNLCTYDIRTIHSDEEI